MEVYAIPVSDKFILYRPLRRLAFVGNEAMARLVLALAQDGASLPPDAPTSAVSYLESIGFLEPDPPPPPLRDPDYRPTNAVILATSRCNLRCVYCYADGGQGPVQDIPLELALTAVDRACENAQELDRPYFELTFHGGGEPTLAWRTVEQVVAHARSKDLPCRATMVSNGVWTERQREWVLHNLDRVTISMDGDPQTQNRQRPLASGQGSFEMVMDTLHALDRHGFEYGIRLTALPPWPGRLARNVAFLCKETGCTRLQVEPAFNTERGAYRPPSAQESQDFVAGFMEAFAIAEEAGCRLHFSGARPRTLTSTFCSAPFGGLIVTPTGDLVTCYEITGPQHPLAEACTIGRLEKGQLVVHQSRRKTFLARLAARREACRDCFCYWHCAGDCHAKAFYPGADATPQTSPRCQMNRSITAQMLLWNIAAAEDGVYRGPRDPGR